MSNKYQPNGLQPMDVTDTEDSIASDVAIDLIRSLGGNIEDHGDRVQTLVMMGVVAALRFRYQTGKSLFEDAQSLDNAVCEFCEAEAVPTALTERFSAVNLCLEHLLFAARDEFFEENIVWIDGLNRSFKIVSV